MGKPTIIDKIAIKMPQKMQYRSTIAVGGTRNQATAKTALATSDALNLDFEQNGPLIGRSPVARIGFYALLRTEARSAKTAAAIKITPATFTV